MRVTALHIAPGRRLPVKYVDSVTAEAGKGLIGDRYHGAKHRHVTLQAQDDLDEAAVALGVLAGAGLVWAAVRALR